MCVCVCVCVVDLKPVNGAAVDEGGKHAESVPEGVADGTHGQHHVKVLTDPVNEVVVHCKGRGFYLFTLS